jgi:hypothetical protein
MAIGSGSVLDWIIKPYTYPTHYNICPSSYSNMIDIKILFFKLYL